MLNVYLSFRLNKQRAKGQSKAIKVPILTNLNTCCFELLQSFKGVMHTSSDERSALKVLKDWQR